MTNLVTAMSFRNVRSLFSGLLILFGSLGLIGWIPGFELLARMRADFIPMAPATAFFFLLYGIASSLTIHVSEKIKGGWPLIAVGFSASLFSAVVLFIWMFGYHIDVEKIFINDAGTFGKVALGRMSPLTALNFLLDGIAILSLTLPGREKSWRIDLAGVLASTAAMVTITVLLGYIFGTPVLYGMGVIPMALSTGLCFLILDSMVLTMVGPKGFPLRPFCADSTHARLLRAFLPVSAVVMIANGLFHQSIKSLVPHLNEALYNALAALTATIILTALITYVARFIGRDIDKANAEKLAVQRQMMAGYKLVALGEMAGNIAHEINNPLAIIEGKARQLQIILSKSPIDTDRAIQFGKAIGESSLRLVKIINGLRTLSKGSEKDPIEERTVVSMIEETVAICNGKLKYDSVKIVVGDIEPKLSVDCRPSEIEQILLNLVANAYDAVVDLDEKWVRIEVEDDEQFIKVFVTDSGKGIAAEIQKKLGSAFFTTKPAGQGTGLGLSISTGLAESFGGSLALDVQSPNTKFVLSLPKRQWKAS